MKTRKILFTLVITLVIATVGFAQSTEFNYQGQLQNSSAIANGSFDFEFAIFDSVSGGTQIGSILTRSSVNVVNGNFAVKLDFGNQFPGASRYLEIKVRSAGGGVFTMLNPRQALESSPYSIKSLTATSADTANTATTASNISNPLAGDVTGGQATTTVARLRGRNVAATPPNSGQVLKFNTTNNQWEPADDETATGGGGGTITGVTPGTGLAGGGTTGSVALSIANGGVGNTQLADGAVTDAKIVSVSGPKVTGAVASATVATGFSGALAGEVTGGQTATAIATGAVTTAKLANSSVTDAKIADVSGSKVNGAVANAANAFQLGGLAPSQYVVTTDPRMSDARTPTAGSTSYIQNQNGAAQASSNFSLSGTGTANIFNATSRYNLGGNRILGVGGTTNTYGGINAGANASGLAENNTFFGSSAGQTMVTAGGNSFFGSEAGRFNTSGGGNSFFGARSGQANTTGDSNSYFGENAGNSNTTGDNNSFYGKSAGSSNQTGSGNSFFGYQAGLSSNTGNNSFFGFTAGKSTTGINNSFFGWSSGTATTTGTNNSYFGVQAGLNNTTGIDNSAFGRDAGRDNIGGNGNSFFGRDAGVLTRNDNNTFIGVRAGNTNFAGSNNTAIGAGSDVASAALDFATAIGAGSSVSTDNTVVLGRTNDTVFVKGELKINSMVVTVADDTLGHAFVFTDASRVLYSTISNPSGNHVCYSQNSSFSNGFYFGQCSSSIRYKKNVSDLPLGLDTIKRLRPVSFDWKAGGARTIGLIAEEVNQIEPLLSVKGNNDVIESVNYDGVTVTLVNAVKQQQAMIDLQQKQIVAQRLLIDRLEKRLRKVERRKR